MGLTVKTHVQPQEGGDRMLTKNEWLFIAPNAINGFPKFDPALLATLFDPLAPVHIWLQDGFVMRSQDFRFWLEQGRGPIELVSPMRIIYRVLRCGDKIHLLMMELHKELHEIQ